ncbi:MAG: glycosyltransferase family 1 protein [Treponema sp.]|nr:glycosyltransferase family 1 protein [Treponema sp.]
MEEKGNDMKLAVDCRMSGKSGIGTFIDGVLPFFAKMDIDLLLVGKSESPVEGKTIACIPCDIKPFSLKEIFAFPKSIADKINSCDAFFSPYCNIPGGIRVPTVCTIHDIVFLDIPSLAGKIGTLARKIFYKRAIRLSKAVCTVSQFSKERILAQLKCKKPISIVYGDAPEYFRKPILPAPQKKDTVIFIGNIKKHKGLQTLLPAFKKFRSQIAGQGKNPPELLIVGSMDNFRTKDTSFDAAELESDGIRFTGFISDQELHVQLSQSRLLVQPSLYEGFGIPPLQALYCGTQAIISDIPVFKEIYANLPVTFFKAGDCEDLCAKMTELWNNPGEKIDFESPYSFKLTAEKIIECIGNVSAGSEKQTNKH